MIIVVVKLDSNWKWVDLIKIQLSCTIYMVGCNSCNLFDNTHNVEIRWVATMSCNLFDNTHSVEIRWVASGHCNLKTKLQC
jgi:hypothetical protein